MHIPSTSFHLEFYTIVEADHSPQLKIGVVFMCDDRHSDKTWWGAFDDPFVCSWDCAEEAAACCVDDLIGKASTRIEWLRSMLGDSSVEVLQRIADGKKIHFEQAEATLLEISIAMNSSGVADKSELEQRINIGDVRIRVSVDDVLVPVGRAERPRQDVVEALGESVEEDETP